jgi:ribonucleoside-diphosphate reductase alpha chain
MRDVLPTRRKSYTQKFIIGGRSVYLGVGLYPDGRLGEIFLDLAKTGSALRFFGHSTATLFSLALQHGTPLATLVDLFIGQCELPNGPVQGHARIKRCSSVIDAVVRSLAIDFLNRQDLADVPAAP